MKSTLIISFLFTTAVLSAQTQDVSKLNVDSVKFQNSKSSSLENNLLSKSDTVPRFSSSFQNIGFNMNYALKDISQTQLHKFNLNELGESSEFKQLNLKFQLPKLSLYNSQTLDISGNKQKFQFALTDIHTVGAKVNWKPDEKLSVVIVPNVWKTYDQFHRNSSADCFGSLNVGLYYKVNEWLTLDAKAQHLFNIYSPDIPSNFFRTNSLGFGAEFRVVNWLSMSVSANYVQLYGASGGYPMIMGGAGIDLYGLFKSVFAKRKKNIPEFWW